MLDFAFWSLIIFSDGKFEAKNCDNAGVYKEKKKQI